MPCQSNIIGIDIGSVAIALAQIDLKGDLIDTAYAFHQGQIESSLRSILNTLDIGQTCGIAATSSIPPIVKTTAQYDTRIAIITAEPSESRSFWAIRVSEKQNLKESIFIEKTSLCNLKCVISAPITAR